MGLFDWNAWILTVPIFFSAAVGARRQLIASLTTLEFKARKEGTNRSPAPRRSEKKLVFYLINVSGPNVS